MDLDDLNQTALRSKRGHRKAWIAKAGTYMETLNSTPMEELDARDVERYGELVRNNQQEYRRTQGRLIEVMEAEDAKDTAITKEVDDMGDNDFAFDTVRNKLKGWERTITSIHEMRSIETNIDGLLVELKEDPKMTRPGARNDLDMIVEQIALMRKTNASLPEVRRGAYAAAIKGFTHRLTALGIKDTTSAISPKTDSKDTSSAISSTLMRTRLPDITFPKFHGDKLQWPLFWEGFNTLLERDDRLTEADKIAYLRMSIKTSEAEQEFAELNGKPGDYLTITKRLESLYLDPRLTFKTQVKGLVEGKVVDRAGALEYFRLITKSMRVLEQSGQSDTNHIVSTMAELKLTGKLREDWIREAGSNKKVPDLGQLTQFLEKVGREQQRLNEDKSKTTPYVTPASKPKKTPVLYAQAEPASRPVYEAPPKPPCKLCNVERHPMFSCPSFKAMSVPQRKEVVLRLKLCSNCLGYGHNPQQCRSRRTCRECKQHHHTALHEGNIITPPQPPTTTNPPPTPTVQQIAYLANASPSGGILPTAIVTVEADGVILQARALLDTCSTASFITNRMVQQLKAVKLPGPVSATGVGDVPGLQCKECTHITVHPRDTSIHPPFAVTAHVSPAVSMVLPLAPLAGVKQLPFLQGLQLADPSFDAPGRVDLLLGLQGTAHMVTGGSRSSDDRRYHAIETIYGWTIMGWDQADHQQAAVYVSVNRPPDNLGAFWETEECQEHGKALSKDEDLAVTHFEENVCRDEDGRYVVSLPKKIPTPELGLSRKQATRRFEQNRRSLQKKGQWTTFGEAVREYLDLGHAERVPKAELNKPEHLCYYLPMHGVVKESSTTTKLRVVFDASARSSNGMSLNDILLPGPNQYPLLIEVLIKFRQHRIGMTSDISKMFREVGLNTTDRDLHRFLWQEEEGPMEVYRMLRVTFGVTSSPFVATQTLRRLAQDYETEYPLAAETVRREFYVDDCITGTDTVEQAIALRATLNGLLGKACMSLRKWRSNSNELQQSIPDDLCEAEMERSLISPEKCHKTLGIHWDTRADVMHISTPTIEADRTATKRQVSSDLARTYDALGWFAPSMVVAKLVIQKLWVMGLEWDEKVPDEVASSWVKWTEELPLLTKHPINRCYFNQDKTRVSTQLHGFADASQLAYGGVVYLRTFYSDTSTTITLVIAKTKVAPIKTVTIPKLELCGAVLLSKLLSQVQRLLKVETSHTYAWTDSTIVLGWLNQKPGRLKVFVANRVIAITDRVPADQWRHVPTESNPADAASRGLMPKELITHSLWWDGPQWLRLEPGQWPGHPDKKSVELPELKTDVVLFTVPKGPKLQLAERYSTLTKLVRITAWLLRFISNARLKDHQRRSVYPNLMTEELQYAEVLLTKCVQHEHFQSEIEALCRGEPLSLKSKLRNLIPLLDKDGVLRVGGRLEQSDLAYPSKHPVILPRQARLVWLILYDLHITNHHVGASTMMGLLAERYSVVGARTAVRTLTRNCVTCRKAHEKNAQQLMGQLPPYRTISSPVFSHVGTDFAGPLIIKSGNPRKPRRTKAFICLFVCMSTKAVHIEVVTDLTTSAFIAALHRFTSRRGLPQVVYSDNGTNFVGAGHELAEAYQLLQKQDSVDQIQRNLSDLRIKWSHTPSRAPHFGGLWESNVKSVKSLLRKTICQATLTYEELSTVLCQVEATLNSRPLVPLNTQPPDGTLALTPGHFLVGRPLRALPSMQVVKPGNLLKRWNLCQQLEKQFWDEWSRAYLVSLNRLNKWVRPQRSIRIGDVVLIKDQDLFLNTWPLGLVTAVHPGPDEKVRAVTVRNQKGEYRRPVVKLTLLIPEEEQTSSLAPEDGRA